MKPHGNPTLEDVAKLAGVSTATVSRCINLPDRVVEKTHKKVSDAIEKLGYTPNFGARVLAANRTFTIGTVIPTMENAIFARGIQAFQEELHQQRYTLLVSSSLYSPEVEKEQIRNLVARGAEGILLIGHERDQSVYDYLRMQNVPVLIAWSFSRNSPVQSVGFDNHTSMSLLAQKVIERGHRQIGMISGIIKGNDRALQRLNGIKHSMSKHALDPAELTVIESPYVIESAAKAFEELMKLPKPPSVVMCGNDVLAVGAIKKAQEMGVRIPEDVSITGFDDIELASLVTPQLATVHVPHREMGRKAAVELVKLVENRSTGRSIELSTVIHLRKSLA
ncbi:MAG: LacI family DNA-binding transcriptional regulator [Alphaproteobacteria bacterium]